MRHKQYKGYRRRTDHVNFRKLTIKNDPHEAANDIFCAPSQFNERDLHLALDEGVNARDNVRRIEDSLEESNNIVNTTQISSTARHTIPSNDKRRLRDIHHQQRTYEEASRVLARNFSLSLNDVRDLSQIHADHIAGHHRSKRQTCKPPIFCNRSRFRSADGSCNNLRNPRWGKSFECVIRLIDPAYADGISRPRVSRSGRPLPNPRLLSGTIHQPDDVPGNFTHMLMQFGHF